MALFVASAIVSAAVVAAIVNSRQPDPIEIAARSHAYFGSLDQFKVWNRQFVETRGREFAGWPIPIELFEPEGRAPRYLFKPGSRYRVSFWTRRACWSTNSWGFRGPEPRRSKRKDGLRVVALGASTTEGSHCDDETPPHYLELELTSRMAPRPIEVINAGHHGFDIHDLLALLESRVLQLEPDIVLLYAANNDIYPGDWTRQAWSGWGCCPGSTRHTFDPSLPSPDRYERWLRAVEEIARRTAARGAELVLASFVTVAHEGLDAPSAGPPLLREAFARDFAPFTPGEVAQMFAHYNRGLADLADRQGLRFCDLAATFPKDVSLFFDHIHFEPAGNRLLASQLADCLEPAL